MKKKWLLIALILSGCTAMRITSSWKNTEVSPQDYNPVMVVGVMRDEDSNLCRKMEQHFADELNKLGYHAISSIAAYGPKAYENIKEEETFKLIYKRNIGAVITIELLNKDTATIYQPQWTREDFLSNYYQIPPQRIYAPANYFLQTIYLWESNYYDMNGFLNLYSVRSETYEPGSAKNMSKEYVQLIMDDMVKKGLLRKQTTALKAF